MPMTVEVCATCGCSEFSHYTVPLPCTEECEPGCDGDHEDPYGESWACECGGCDSFHYMEDPDELVCVCGCPESEHADDLAYEDDDDLDGVADRPCSNCDCASYLEAGTAHDVLLEQLAGRGLTWPAPRRYRSGAAEVRVRWFDGPLRVVGALIADGDGQPARTAGVPDPDDRVFLLFAETEDGLEVAISREELV